MRGEECYVNGFFRGLSPTTKVAEPEVAIGSWLPILLICVTSPPPLRELNHYQTNTTGFLKFPQWVQFYIARCRLKLQIFFKNYFHILNHNFLNYSLLAKFQVTQFPLYIGVFLLNAKKNNELQNQSLRYWLTDVVLKTRDAEKRQKLAWGLLLYRQESRRSPESSFLSSWTGHSQKLRTSKPTIFCQCHFSALP